VEHDWRDSQDRKNRMRRSGSPSYSGKTFEGQFRKSMEEYAWVLRIPDAVFLMAGGGTASAKTPADFVVVVPKSDVIHFMLVECKAIGGISIPFDRLDEHQNGYLTKVEGIHPHCHGLVAINFYGEDVRLVNRLFMVPIEVWNEYATRGDRKSLPVSSCELDPRIIECPRVKGSIWEVSQYIAYM
jgi:hypothetical protein